MSMPALSAILFAALTVLALALLQVPPEAISSQDPAGTDTASPDTDASSDGGGADAAPPVEYSRSERKAIATQNAAATGSAGGDAGGDSGASGSTSSQSADASQNGASGGSQSAGQDDASTASGPLSISGGEAFTFPTDVPQNSTSFGIDVSHFNIQKGSSKVPINWADVKTSGASFVYIKASQGRTVQDSEFDTNWSGAGAASLSRGAYHFLSALSDAAAQADFFLSVYDDRSSDDRAPALDMEWDYTAEQVDRWAQKSPAQIVAMADTWLRAVAKETGKTPIIYSNRDWWQARIGPSGDQLLKEYPVWLADYTTTPAQVEAPPAEFASVDLQLWQFTDKGTVPGVDGVVDVNFIVPPTR